jgi:hypothetical protein
MGPQALGRTEPIESRFPDLVYKGGQTVAIAIVVAMIVAILVAMVTSLRKTCFSFGIPEGKTVSTCLI